MADRDERAIKHSAQVSVYDADGDNVITFTLHEGRRVPQIGETLFRSDWHDGDERAQTTDTLRVTDVQTEYRMRHDLSHEKDPPRKTMLIYVMTEECDD